MKCHNRGYGLIVESVWRGGAAFGWPTIRVQRAWKVAHDSVRMFGVSVAVDGVAMAQAAYRRWAGALWVRAQKRGSGEAGKRIDDGAISHAHVPKSHKRRVVMDQ